MDRMSAVSVKLPLFSSRKSASAWAARVRVPAQLPAVRRRKGRLKDSNDQLMCHSTSYVRWSRNCCSHSGVLHAGEQADDKETVQPPEPSVAGASSPAPQPEPLDFTASSNTRIQRMLCCW